MPVGLIRRLARKVKKELTELKDEANHPGRPAAHRESENRYWEDKPKKADAKAEAEPKAEPKEKKGTDERSDFWFLDGDNEGWGDTNPDKD